MRVMTRTSQDLVPARSEQAVPYHVRYDDHANNNKDQDLIDAVVTEAEAGYRVFSVNEIGAGPAFFLVLRLERLFVVLKGFMVSHTPAGGS
jgi:hypothetical protein